MEKYITALACSLAATVAVSRPQGPETTLVGLPEITLVGIMVADPELCISGALSPFHSVHGIDHESDAVGIERLPRISVKPSSPTSRRCLTNQAISMEASGDSSSSHIARALML